MSSRARARRRTALTGSTASYTQVGLPNNTAQNLTIYARIPAAQDVRAGTYTDSVTVTIDF